MVSSITMRGFGFFQPIEGIQLYPAGRVIFEEGQPGAELYVIVEGAVDITLEGRPIDHLEAGSIFGEMALVDERPRSATAVAATDCKILPVNQARFASLVQQEPDFATQVMKIMSVRMRNLMEEEIQRQRLEEELAIGRQIQLSLLPDRCPDIPGWEITAVYRAARQIGGDLYDFILPPDDPQTLNLVIADVTGKGVPAALFMAFSRTIIRAEAAHGLGPAATLMRANQFIYRDVYSQLFLTAFYASLDTQTGRMVFANGGHDWPLLLRASTHEIRVLKTPGLILGAFPEVSLEEAEITVAPGDALIFYTDGVTEARNADDQFFGEERLEAVLAAHRGDGAEVLLQSVVTAVAQFVGSTPQSDDLTLVVVKRQAL